MSRITGAGILLLELYKNTPVITLFGNINKKFEELGGTIDKGETAVHTAYREGREESCNLIYITPDELKKYGTVVKYKDFVDYIMYIEGISYKDYHENRRKVHKKCKSNHWKETSEMVRIHLNDIITAAKNKKKTVKDINGIKRDIRSRTMGIIRKSIDSLYALFMDNYPTLMQKQKVKQSRNKCLIGTITYTLSKVEKRQLIQPIIDISLSPNSSPSVYQYAVYIAPDINQYSLTHSFLLNCNLTWADRSKPGTGMHVTITGFDENQPNIQAHLNNISNSGNKLWTMNLKTVDIKRNIINFQSNTLNAIADYLMAHGFKRVKGPRYAGIPWHMTSECAIPTNIYDILNGLTWSLVVVSRDNNGVIRWHNRYPLTTS